MKTLKQIIKEEIAKTQKRGLENAAIYKSPTNGGLSSEYFEFDEKEFKFYTETEVYTIAQKACEQFLTNNHERN